MATAGKPKSHEKTDRLQLITDQVVEALERGVKPWQKPWDANNTDGDPVNLSSGHKYRGANLLLLSLLSPFGGADNRWATFKQSRDMGLMVRKGEKGVPVLFFSPHTMDDKLGRLDDSGNIRQVTTAIIRTSTAFHVSQLEEVDGKIPPLTPPDPSKTPWKTPDAINRIVETAGIEIRHGGSRAAWSPTQDIILMPRLVDFHSIDGYNSCLLHEYSHSTSSSNPMRLNREIGKKYGDHKYAYEELIAEFSAMMTCQALGLHYDIEHHASYLESWASMMKDGNTKNVLFRAASAAQAASDYILMNWDPVYAKAHAAERAAELAEDVATQQEEPTSTAPSPVFVSTRTSFDDDRSDGRGRADILSGMDITEVDGKSDMMSFPSVTEITPAFAAGSDVSDGKGHSGVVVDGADAAPTVAWPTAPRQSEDDAEDAARAARLTATVATRTAKAPGVQMDLFGSRP